MARNRWKVLPFSWWSKWWHDLVFGIPNEGYILSLDTETRIAYTMAENREVCVDETYNSRTGIIDAENRIADTSAESRVQDAIESTRIAEISIESRIVTVGV